MKQFSRLFAELDATTSTNAKVEALQRYFAAATPRDAAWAVYFLAGGKPRQVVNMAIACAAGVRGGRHRALAVRRVLPGRRRPGRDHRATCCRAAETSDVGLAEWVEQRLLPLRGLPPEEIAQRVRG